MGRIVEPAAAKLICGIITARPELLGDLAERLAVRFGPVDAASGIWPFDFTDYYAREMGSPLVRQFLAFERLVDQGRLAEAKLFTNGLEGIFSAESGGRCANLDPGYVTAQKLVLATTKDAPHRIYIAGGIYAEITLRVSKGAFEPCPWTYPDYRTERYRGFFDEVRRRLVEQTRQG